jgi:hypothetical protein
VKLDELVRRVGVDNVGVQVLANSITGAKQKRGFIEMSFGTDCVSMRDIATGDWENVVFVVSIKRADFEAAREASAKEQKP